MKFSLAFIISIILSILLGAVFVFSAYTKLYPIQPFEYTFIDIGVANWMTAPFIARGMIGLEFFCGILLILNFQLRRFTIPLVASILAAFCVYLLLVMHVKGNQGNCGCFGEYFAMTPMQAIIKNIGLLIVCFLIYLLTVPFKFPAVNYSGLLCLALGLTLPFILNRVDLENSKDLRPEAADYPLPLDILYQSKNPVNLPPRIELRHGKYIIAYLSLTCPHCRIAAQKIHVLHKTDPSIPFYLVLNGKRELYQPYIDSYGLADIPHQIFFGPEEYVKMSGPALPEILWVNNSTVEKKGSYQNLTQTEINKWLSAADTTSGKP